jgi:hypothetical protein
MTHTTQYLHGPALREKLIQIEVELKNAKGEEARKLHARFEKIRRDINYLTA